MNYISKQGLTMDFQTWQWEYAFLNTIVMVLCEKMCLKSDTQLLKRA